MNNYYTNCTDYTYYDLSGYGYSSATSSLVPDFTSIITSNTYMPVSNIKKNKLNLKLDINEKFRRVLEGKEI